MIANPKAPLTARSMRRVPAAVIEPESALMIVNSVASVPAPVMLPVSCAVVFLTNVPAAVIGAGNILDDREEGGERSNT